MWHSRDGVIGRVECRCTEELRAHYQIYCLNPVKDKKIQNSAKAEENFLTHGGELWYHGSPDPPFSMKNKSQRNIQYMTSHHFGLAVERICPGLGKGESKLAFQFRGERKKHRFIYAPPLNLLTYHSPNTQYALTVFLARTLHIYNYVRPHP